MADRKYLDITPGFPLRETEKWICNVRESESGIEFRSSPSEYPRREWDLSWHSIDRTSKVEAIRDIVNYCNGKGESFFWKEPNITSRNRIKVGMGTGARTGYLLPTKSWTTQTIRIDGVVQTLTTDYSYSVGGGQNGLDVVVFNTTVPMGSLIELDYTNGYLVALVHGDVLDESLLPAGYNYSDLDITLRESKEEWPSA